MKNLFEDDCKQVCKNGIGYGNIGYIGYGNIG